MENNKITFKDYPLEHLKWKNLEVGSTVKVKLNEAEGVVTCSKNATTDNLEVELILKEDNGLDYILRFDRDTSMLFDSLQLTLGGINTFYKITLENKLKDIKEVWYYRYLSEALWDYDIFITPRPHFYTKVTLEKIEGDTTSLIKSKFIGSYLNKTE